MRTYPDWLLQELLNWSRYCWQGESPIPTPQTTCASYEKHWKSIEWEQDDDERSAIYVDIRSGEHVDMVIKAIKDPMTRMLLIAAFPKRRMFDDIKEAAAWVGVKPANWDDELNRAVWLVGDRLGAKRREAA